MPLQHLTEPSAVLKAIEECDRLGRDQFLHEYGFGRARRYMLQYNASLYDSKAILGAAHGVQFPNEGPLQSSELHGGEQTVSKLQELGFTVLNVETGQQL